MNLLAQETSPYLLQHKDNPVHWRPWNAEALAAAKAENKPILLSVGYAACHWCHVMAHESFESEVIAAQMNQDFICIKVDKEERPDIDQIYQSALAVMGGQGGWPLTMFLDTDGKPFFGGTYFPPSDAHGRPGFPTVLAHIANMWANDPASVENNRSQIMEALAGLSRTDTDQSQTLTPGYLNPLAKKLARQVDPFDGGFGDAPKFPNAGGIELLWRGYLRTGLQPFETMVVNTLTQMCEGGIYDHLGGGFARYSVDERWLVPHFEKMLYDNAQLLEVLTKVWRGTCHPLFKQRALETADFVIRDLTLEGGAFAATLDADTVEGEGAYYSWTPDEISEVLPADQVTAFCQHYDITQAGNFEGRSIPNRLHALHEFDADEDAALAAARTALYEARLMRPRPARDDKVLADWNGQMIAALAHAGDVFGKAPYIHAAQKAFSFICTQMMSPDGRITHSWAAGQLGRAETLDDLAHMARAALALYRVTQDEAYIEKAELMVEAANHHFYDAAGGAYYTTPADGEALITRPRNIFDNAVPNANATLVSVLSKLQALTGKPDYAARALQIVKAYSSQAVRGTLGAATFINAYENLAFPISLVVVGDEADSAVHDLLDEIAGAALPSYTLMQTNSTGHLPGLHPAKDKTKLDGKATAYICVGQTCFAPVNTSEDLRAALAPTKLWPR